LWSTDNLTPADKHSLLTQFTDEIGTKYADDVNQVLDEIERKKHQKSTSKKSKKK